MAETPAEALVGALGAIVPAMQQRAAALDEAAAFPSEDMAALCRLGVLAAPLPRALGGHGAGTEAEGAAVLLAILRLLGYGHLAVARLFEAHVNALRLVVRFGHPEQAAAAAADVHAGHLFALWVTDPPGAPVRIQDQALAGTKSPCSGAGHATRAVVTAELDGATRMVVVALDGQPRAAPLPASLQGMRASATGSMRLDGLAATDVLGAPGDYLREPDFSAGAWRTTAATLGGLDSLVDVARAALVQRGQAGAVPQQERFGLAWIALETARLWTGHAAAIAEAGDGEEWGSGAGDGKAATCGAAGQVAYVNLARIAVEHATLDAIRHVQRSLGLAAFLRPSPAERIARDLATYLRQPAPDAVLTEAAAHLLGRPR